ncbi:acyl carrier protein [Elusimicrobiota bacterium]
MDVKRTIKEFIISSFLTGSDPEILSDDDSFLEKGIVDSTGILELVGFIEETFKVRFEDDELAPDNLDSINNIEGFVSRKQNNG